MFQIGSGEFFIGLSYTGNNFRAIFSVFVFASY